MLAAATGEVTLRCVSFCWRTAVKRVSLAHSPLHCIRQQYTVYSIQIQNNKVNSNQDTPVSTQAV